MTWTGFESYLDDYQRHLTLSERLGLGKREGRFVLCRIGLLVLLVMLAYTVPLGWPLWWIVAAVLLRDALLMATAHAFLKNQKEASVVRFVTLNILTYLSLMLWCAVALGPFRRAFSPPLSVFDALKIGFATVTASATVPARTPEDGAVGAVLVLAFFNVLALFWLLVILVSAVARIDVRGAESNQ